MVVPRFWSSAGVRVLANDIDVFLWYQLLLTRAKRSGFTGELWYLRLLSWLCLL